MSFPIPILASCWRWESRSALYVLYPVNGGEILCRGRSCPTPVHPPCALDRRRLENFARFRQATEVARLARPYPFFRWASNSKTLKPVSETEPTKAAGRRFQCGGSAAPTTTRRQRTTSQETQPRPQVSSRPDGRSQPFPRRAIASGVGCAKLTVSEDGIIIRLLFQRAATADLASADQMIGHDSTANVESAAPTWPRAGGRAGV